MNIAVITGASSGMGAEFVRELDRTEPDLDAFWLIARRKERLEEVAAQLRHPARVFPMDLTERKNFDVLGEALREAGADVRVLVNCAGYGKIGNYAGVSREDSVGMIDLNCAAAVEITLTCLPYMHAGGRIIQLCSTAAFQPLQHINIYSATKSFLYHYTRALRMELLPRKIAVLAVCPFWVKDTEFIGIADKKPRDGNAAGERPIRHFFFATTAEHVVRRALHCSRRGYAVCTPGAFCTIDRFFAKLLPRESILFIWEMLRRV